MQSKRILIPLLAVLLIALLAGTVSVSAAEAAPSLDLAVEVSASDAVMADPMVVQPGDTLTVSVAIENNPGFMWLTLNLSYNADLLEVVTDENGIVHTLNKDVVGDLTAGEYSVVEEEPGLLYVALLPSGFADVANNTGDFLEISFKVKEDAHGDLNFGLEDVKARDVLLQSMATTVVDDAAYVHTFTAAPVVNEGSCTAPGTKTYTCDECDEDVVVTFGTATGHDMTFVPAANATCDEEGNLAYYSCANCGKFFTDEAGVFEVTAANITITALGHTVKALEAKTATCLEDGVIACWQCEVCEKYFSDEAATQELAESEAVIPAAGHQFAPVNGTPATCTQDGLTAGSACSVCGEAEEGKAQETIPAPGHKWVIDEAVDPTYSSEGKTEGKHCEVCGEVAIPQDVIPQKSLAWLWILIAVVVVAAAGVVAYFFIFKKKVKRY